MTDLIALAERVEKLEGGDREVDAMIAWTLHWRWDGWDEDDLKIEDRPLEYVIERIKRGHNSIWINIPRYTASLDAAMTLVPKGHVFTVSDWWMEGDGRAAHFADCGDGGKLRDADDTEIHQAWAKSNPLALTAAALRARASME